MTRRFEPTDRATSLWVFGVALVALVLTTNRTVPAGDSGELIAVAYGHGVAHPPGYPLFTLLGSLFATAVPFGSVAFRVNLVSAVSGAVAAALLCILTRRLTGSRSAGVVAAALWLSSPIVWTYASVAEVFTLNVALGLWAVLLVLELHRRLVDDDPAGVRRRAVWTGLAFGLGMSNHHTTVLVLFAAASLLLVEVLRRRIALRAAAGALGMAALGGLAGLSCYLHLPLAAAGDAAVSWGQCDTVAGFVDHFLRRDYGTMRLVSPDLAADVALFDHTLVFLSRLALDSWLVLPVLVVAGVLRARGAGPLLVLAALIWSGPVFLGIVNAPLEPPVFRGVIERFYILPLAFAAVIGGVGFAALARDPRVRWVAVVALSGLGVAGFARSDQSDNAFDRDHASNLLRCLPENALLFSRSDLVTNTLDYALHVEAEREDVVVLDQEKLTYGWFAAASRRRHPDIAIPGERYDGVEVTSLALIEANGGRPVLFVDFKDDSYRARYAAVVHGLLRRMVPLGQEPPPAESYATNLALWASFEKQAMFREFAATTFEYEGQRAYADFLWRLGYMAEQLGKLEDAARHYANSGRLDHERYEPFQNLAAVLERLGRYSTAADALETSLERRDPGPEVDALRATVDALRAR